MIKNVLNIHGDIVIENILKMYYISLYQWHHIVIQMQIQSSNQYLMNQKASCVAQESVF